MYVLCKESIEQEHKLPTYKNMCKSIQYYFNVLILTR